MFFVFGIITIVALGVLVSNLIYNGNVGKEPSINPKLLCLSTLFEGYRLYPIICCFFFWIALVRIKKSVLENGLEDQYSQRVQQMQLVTLSKLSKVIKYFLFVSLTLVIFDNIYKLKAQETELDCNNSLFSGNLDPLNSVVWLFTRAISTSSAELVTIYLFHKQKYPK